NGPNRDRGVHRDGSGRAVLADVGDAPIGPSDLGWGKLVPIHGGFVPDSGTVLPGPGRTASRPPTQLSGPQKVGSGGEQGQRGKAAQAASLGETMRGMVPITHNLSSTCVKPPIAS